jgi:Ni,Fe-hydrogenase III large subunit
MVKSLRTNKINGVVDIEIHKDELKNIVQSVNYMTDKVKKELLENLPSSEEGRKRLDGYAALKEDLRKILEDLH